MTDEFLLDVVRFATGRVEGRPIVALRLQLLDGRVLSFALPTKTALSLAARLVIETKDAM